MADDGSVASVARARIANCNWQMFKLSRFFSHFHFLIICQRCNISQVQMNSYQVSSEGGRVLHWDGTGVSNSGCASKFGRRKVISILWKSLRWDKLDNYFGMISIDILRIIELVLNTVIMHLWSIDLIMPSGRLQIAKAFHCGSSWRACEVGVGVLAAVKAVKERRWRDHRWQNAETVHAFIVTLWLQRLLAVHRACFKILQNASKCFKMLQNASKYFKMLQNASRCFKMLQNTSKCFKMLQDASKCFKMLQNASKCFKMLQNASKYFKMLQNTSKCFKMLQNASKCFKMLRRCFKMLQDASKCFKILQNASRCFKMLQNASKYFKMLQNASRCFKMLQNASKCFKMLQDASKCFKILQNASKCFKMLQNASKCFKMLQNASKCFKMHQNASKCFKVLCDSPIVFALNGTSELVGWPAIWIHLWFEEWPRNVHCRTAHNVINPENCRPFQPNNLTSSIFKPDKHRISGRFDLVSPGSSGGVSIGTAPSPFPSPLEGWKNDQWKMWSGSQEFKVGDFQSDCHVFLQDL